MVLLSTAHYYILIYWLPIDQCRSYSVKPECDIHIFSTCMHDSVRSKPQKGALRNRPEQPILVRRQEPTGIAIANSVRGLVSKNQFVTGLGHNSVTRMDPTMSFVSKTHAYPVPGDLVGAFRYTVSRKGKLRRRRHFGCHCAAAPPCCTGREGVVAFVRASC
jgi:hypothetical protein